jgi:protein-L-isoaspartate(D-aspartate) O-methyltransferase
MDDRAARLGMIEDQLVARGIRDPRLLDAVARLPREAFVPEDLRDLAYADRPLPIGHGQTISQPYTTAFMTEALGLRGPETVLEVGTGSGYGAALLGCLARRVYSVERIAPLAAEAGERLRRLGFTNVEVLVANGTLGLPNAAPFDAIVVTAGSDALPPPYAEQLADGGRIVIPLGTEYDQVLTRFTRRGDHLEREPLGHFTFVPLIGEYGRLDDAPWLGEW